MRRWCWASGQLPISRSLPSATLPSALPVPLPRCPPILANPQNCCSGCYTISTPYFLLEPPRISRYYKSPFHLSYLQVQPPPRLNPWCNGARQRPRCLGRDAVEPHQCFCWHQLLALTASLVLALVQALVIGEGHFGVQPLHLHHFHQHRSCPLSAFCPSFATGLRLKAWVRLDPTCHWWDGSENGARDPNVYTNWPNRDPNTGGREDSRCLWEVVEQGRQLKWSLPLGLLVKRHTSFYRRSTT